MLDAESWALRALGSLDPGEGGLWVKECLDSAKAPKKFHNLLDNT